MLLIFVLAIVLPISTSFWIISSLVLSANEDSSDVRSPTRWFLSFLLPLVLVAWALKKGIVDFSGAVAGILMGFVTTFSNYCFLAIFASLLIVGRHSNKCTNLNGSPMSWAEILCKCGVAAEMALLYLIDRGCGERVVDFTLDYRGSWIGCGVIASYACSVGTTMAVKWGGERSKGKWKPFLVTSLRRVPVGTNGAISLEGLLSAALGGLLVGSVFYCSLLCFVSQMELLYSPSQWPIVILGTLCGLFGSILNSLLGSTVQYSGYNSAKGLVVDRPGPYTEHISGLPILDGKSINLLSTLIVGLASPKVAMFLWEFV